MQQNSIYVKRAITKVSSKLELKHDSLYQSIYIPSLFNLSNINFSLLEQLITLSDPIEVNPEIWYADKKLSYEKPSSFDEYLKLSHNCLPIYIKNFQYQLLSLLFSKSCSGWTTELFFSHKYGASLGMHCDSDDVYTIQIYGKKLWTIDALDIDWFQNCVENKHFFKIGNSTSWLVDKNAKEKINFRSPISVLLNPGDFLAIPAFSLHKVESLTDGLSFSCNLSLSYLNKISAK